MGNQWFLKIFNRQLTFLLPEGVNEVKLWQLVQVEDSRRETRDEDVSRLVVGGRCQVVKIPLFVEEVSTRAGKNNI